MPIYSYRCVNCNNLQEHQFLMSNKPNTVKCNDCGDMARQIIRGVQLMIPEAFSKWSRSSFTMTYEQAKEQDRKNEEYLRNKPKDPPTFRELLKQELNK